MCSRIHSVSGFRRPSCWLRGVCLICLMVCVWSGPKDSSSVHSTEGWFYAHDCKWDPVCLLSPCLLSHFLSLSLSLCSLALALARASHPRPRAARALPLFLSLTSSFSLTLSLLPPSTSTSPASEYFQSLPPSFPPFLSSLRSC